MDIKQKILEDGYVLEGDILKVDSFLNHQLDIVFLDKIAKEIYDKHKAENINKILTIESSGIAIAALCARYFGVKVLFAKKMMSKNIGQEVYSAEVKSYTKGNKNNIVVSKKYLSDQDKVLIIDDFLAMGEALKGLISLCEQANAKVSSCAIVIEKYYQNGGNSLRAKGYNIDSLVKIKSMKNKVIEFID